MKAATYGLTLSALLAITSANATIYDFTGAIDSGEFFHAGAFGIHVGAEFSGLLEYDPEAMVEVRPGIYDFALVRYEFNVGGHSYSSGSPAHIRYSATAQTFDDIVPKSGSSNIFVDDVRFDFEGLFGAPPSLDWSVEPISWQL
jgi:hypothetical protein